MKRRIVAELRAQRRAFWFGFSQPGAATRWLWETRRAQ